VLNRAWRDSTVTKLSICGEGWLEISAAIKGGRRIAAHLIGNVGHVYGGNAAGLLEVLMLVSFVDDFSDPGDKQK